MKKLVALFSFVSLVLVACGGASDSPAESSEAPEAVAPLAAPDAPATSQPAE